MQTAKANQIDNEQIDEITAYEARQFRGYAEQFSGVCEVCAERGT
jgi:hypothetical protein